jgi:hypothetical protein
MSVENSRLLSPLQTHHQTLQYYVVTGPLTASEYASGTFLLEEWKEQCNGGVLLSLQAAPRPTAFADSTFPQTRATHSEALHRHAAYEKELFCYYKAGVVQRFR